MSNHHFTRAQRSELGALKAAGIKQNKIAAQLGVHPSTISRELQRYRTRNKSGYQAATAALLARRRRAGANGLRRKLICDPKLRRYVTSKLKLNWSPEQICAGSPVRAILRCATRRFTPGFTGRRLSSSPTSGMAARITATDAAQISVGESAKSFAAAGLTTVQSRPTSAPESATGRVTRLSEPTRRVDF
jgi:hypothetical protein